MASYFSKSCFIFCRVFGFREVLIFTQKPNKIVPVDIVSKSCGLHHQSYS